MYDIVLLVIYKIKIGMIKDCGSFFGVSQVVVPMEFPALLNLPRLSGRGLTVSTLVYQAT